MTKLNNFITINSKKPEFIVVGDTHFCNQPPSCRIDNYSETCLKKLEYVLDYSIENNISLIIIEGDVFHKQQIPIHYLTKIISLINEKKILYKNKYNEDLILASIIGNHDLPFENFKYIEKSPICLLFEAGCLTHFRHISIHALNEDIEISGFDYSKTIEKSNFKNECCVAHCFFGFDFLNSKLESAEQYNDRISEDEADKLGYSVYFLGHDHTFYGITEKKNYTVVRPGSLLRNSSHIQQINRIPCFYHVVKLNDSYIFKKVDVTIALNSSAIFTSESLLKPKKQEVDENVKTKISDIILSLSEEETVTDSISDLLNEIVKSQGVNNDVYNLLLKYFSRQNVL